MIINPTDVAFVFNNEDGTSTVGVNVHGEVQTRDPKTGKAVVVKKTTVVNQIVSRNEANQLAALMKKQEEQLLKYERENGRQVINQSITDREIRHYGQTKGR